MKDRTGIPDFAKVSMIMDFECVLSLDTLLHYFDEGVNLFLGQRGLECNLRKFKFSASLERLPRALQISTWNLNLTSTSLIYTKRDNIGGPFGVWMILNLDIINQGTIFTVVAASGN
jgi:hypothetical protein